MPIAVQCSICGQAYAAPEEWAGRSTACLVCRSAIQIPALPSVEPYSVPQPAPPIGGPTATPAAFRPNTTNDASGLPAAVWIAAAGSAAVVLLLVVVVAVRSSFSQRSDPGTVQANSLPQAPASPAAPSAPSPQVPAPATPVDSTGSPAAQLQPSPPADLGPAKPPPGQPSISAKIDGASGQSSVVFRLGGPTETAKPWTYVPQDPVALDKPAAVVIVPPRGTSVERIRVAGLASGDALAELRPLRSDVGPPVNLVARLDLRRGQFGSAQPMPKNSQLLDLSPDGKSALLMLGERFGEYDHLMLVDLAAKTGRQWPAEFGGKLQFKNQIAWGALLEGGLAIAVSEDGCLRGWDLSQPRLVVDLGEYRIDKSPTLSPDRRYLVTTLQRRDNSNPPPLVVLDAATGKECGHLQRPEGVQSYQAEGAAFSSDGKRLFAIYRASVGGFTCRVWELTRGTPVATFPLVMAGVGSARVLGWCGPRHVLVENNIHGQVLVDIEGQAAVWRFANEIACVRPDGWAWAALDYRVNAGARPPASRYKAVQIPSPEVLAAIERGERAAAPLLDEGESVSLDLQMTAAPPNSDWTKRFREQLVERLAHFGHRVEDRARVRVEVAVSEHDRGRTLEYARQFGSRGGTIGPTLVTIPDRYLTVRLDFVDAAGKAVHSRPFGASVFHEITMREGRDPVQEYLDQRWAALEQELAQLALPRKLMAPQQLQTLGMSLIDERRETITGK